MYFFIIALFFALIFFSRVADRYRTSTTTTCPGGLVLCGNSCKDTVNDFLFCGSCNNSCNTRSYAACSNSVCICDTASLFCEGSCFNTRTSNAHCGSCINSCSTNTTCSAGSCVCNPGYNLLCGNKCYDSLTNGLNCGSCGLACTGSNMIGICSSGKCACQPGYLYSNGVCVQNASFNSCNGVNCATISNTVACVNNLCACNTATGWSQTTAGVNGCSCNYLSGLTDDWTLNGTQCVNLMADSNNCGGLDNLCDSEFHTGECFHGECVCSQGSIQCSNICTNITSNSENCGACGNVCGATSTCSNSQCIDLRTVQNCFALGNDCTTKTNPDSSLFVTPVCLSTDDVRLGGEQCIDANSNALYCGAYSLTVPNSLQCSNQYPQTGLCVNASCSCIGDLVVTGFNTCACPSGLTDCAFDGTCVDSLTDAANCGSCGFTCTSQETCTGGECIVVQNTESTNCGELSINCVALGAPHTGECVDYNYEGNFICACGNGYEVDCTCPADLGKIDCAPFCVPNDESNCGACGNACEGLTCCLVGDVNDCVDTTTNNDNCNGCGQTCSDGLQCVGGNCTTTVPPPNTLTTNCGDTSANCETLGGLYDGGCQQFGLGTSGYGCTCGFGYNTNPSTGACECDQQDCGTTCTSINDPNNCGSCEVQCQGEETCCGAGGCKNLQNDFYNCGQCGKQCETGESCAGVNGCQSEGGGDGGGGGEVPIFFTLDNDCGPNRENCENLALNFPLQYTGHCVPFNGDYKCGEN